MVTVKIGNWTLGFGTKHERATRKRPLTLVIMNGWGYSNKKDGNAIALAKTPNYDRISAKYPHTLLSASGFRTGSIPKTQQTSGNDSSNFDSDQIVKTAGTMVLEAIKSGAFFENKVLRDAFKKADDRKSAVHLVGLISDGNVHSSMDALFSLLRMAKETGDGNRVFVHGILDGQDVSEHTADVYIEALLIKMVEINCGEIATLCGRDYAMNQKQNWERTARAYTMLVHSDGERAFDPVRAIHSSFLRGNSDKFIQPIVLENQSGEPIGQIKHDDVVIFFNHRADGIKQLVRSLAVRGSDDSATLVKPNIDVVCLTQYDQSFDLPVAFESRESRLAELEKHASVTYYFDGGDEIVNSNDQIIKNLRPPNRSYSAIIEPHQLKVADALLKGIEIGKSDVFIVNLAAADIFAHTGSLQKTIEAVQYVDFCLGSIVDKIQEIDGIALITSDHGNCEEMLSNKVSKNFHNSNPVPFHFVMNDLNGLRLRDGGALKDVTPTILGILGIEKPNEMTGVDLRETGTF